MMNDQNLNTFWKLINTYRIEIPIIQRDYAQGREDVKTTGIRKAFVEAIAESLTGSGSLHLDFVYGRISGKDDILTTEKNRQAVAELLQSVRLYSDQLDMTIAYSIEPRTRSDSNRPATFIPLDGQQRLTTLFLLHWYLSSRLRRNDAEILNGFTYRTRKSSNKFCSVIVTNGSGLSFSGSPAGEIRDSTWFFRNWSKDPTVRGMLVMIDKIHDTFAQYGMHDLEKIWKKLTHGGDLTFRFLDLDKFRLTDDLYVKMNARGRHLSDFENFKAWLQDEAKERSYKIRIPDWHTKLDIKWMDMIWAYRRPGTYEIDNEYLGFFHLAALFNYTEMCTEEITLRDEQKETMELFRKPAFIAPAVYRDSSVFSEAGLNRVLLFLDCIHGHLHSLEMKLAGVLGDTAAGTGKNFFGRENSGLTWFDAAFLYSIFRFIIQKKKKLQDYDDHDSAGFTSWTRVCRNLIYNTYINSPDGFFSAVRSVDKLCRHSGDIYRFLSSPKVQIPFFAAVQRDEEVLKAGLIIADRKWEKEFITLEKHSYFNGQIGFILSICENNAPDISYFTLIGSRCAAVFGPEILNGKDFLLHRALLSFKNYFLPAGANLNICSGGSGLREKEENWRKVLRDKDRLNAFQQMICGITESDVRKGLLRIIKNYKEKSWKRYFIAGPEPFQCCSQHLLRADSSKEDILLFKTLRIYGNHAELRTYSFYCNRIKDRITDFTPFTAEYYYYNPRNESRPCIVLYGFEYRKTKYELQVYYRPRQSEFELRMIPWDEKTVTAAVQKALETAGFTCPDTVYKSYARGEKILAEKIKILCSSLASVRSN